MLEPAILIRLDDDGRVYLPGDTLAGEYELEGVVADQIHSLEVSVLWYTEGKGDEDLAVHEFWRFDADNGDTISPERAGRFQTVLPASPLSYEGQIVKLRWCVRVRLFLYRGREVVADKAFRLGDVAAAAPPPEPPAEEAGPADAAAAHGG
jgi:hypothetical protein